jgi:hypothetical protein
MTMKARADDSTHSHILDPLTLTTDRSLKCYTFVIEIPELLWICNYLNACYLKLWIATHSRVLKNCLKHRCIYYISGK